MAQQSLQVHVELELWFSLVALLMDGLLVVQMEQEQMVELLMEQLICIMVEHHKPQIPPLRL